MPAEDDFPPLPKIPSILGVRVSGIAAGLKDNGKHDLFVAELVPGSTIAGTLTRSRVLGCQLNGVSANYLEVRFERL